MTLAGFAQNEIKSGYYRVINSNSGWYCWLVDQTGGVNGTTAQMYALQVTDPTKFSPISEPASVIYVEHISGTKYDLKAQGTSVKSFTGFYLTIDGNAKTNKYQVSANYQGATLYLAEDTKLNARRYHDVTTSASATSRLWSPLPVSSSSADNYFGIKPTMKIGDKYYAPFYASFPFSFASDGMKAYIISEVADDDVAIISEVKKNIIPASTPVLIECSSEDPSKNRLELLEPGSYPSVGVNALKGVYFCSDFIDTDKSTYCRTTFDPKKMRVWNVNAEGKLCLSTATDLLHVSYYSYEKDRYLNANSSYLPVVASANTELKIMTDEEYDEYLGIEDIMLDNAGVSHIYSVDGKQLKSAQSGINIVRTADGKVRKVLNK